MDRIERKLDAIDEKLDNLVLAHAHQSKDISQNTKDLAEHIRRTNLLEGKLQQLWYAIYLGAGVAIAQGWPALSKIIGKLI